MVSYRPTGYMNLTWKRGYPQGSSREPWSSKEHSLKILGESGSNSIHFTDGEAGV